MIEQLRTTFGDPGAKYSPIPFWFWNDELHKEELLRQLRSFHDKEVEGFVLHPRIGIPRSMPYLSDDFMDLVEAVVAEAAALHMNVMLYDEGMYPSGAANGEVVRRQPTYASRGLRMISGPLADGQTEAAIVWTLPLEEGDRVVSVQAVPRTEAGNLRLDKSQVLEVSEAQTVIFDSQAHSGAWTLLAFIDGYSGGTIRGIHEDQDDGQPDAPKAADLLNAEAVQLFIALTHERYYARIGAYFGSTVIAMFTDEPDLLGRRHRKGLQPWTADFLHDFCAVGNREQDLPAIFLEAGAETAAIRTRYRKAVRKRMEQSYYKPLHDWCAARGIALTGHPAGSDDIGLLRYFHIPGQDIVWRWLAPEEERGITGKHSTMGKCSADAARHRGRARNLNECFGVCGKDYGWALTADDMKWYLDWLFVRGVNLIAPHAFYYSIAGKRLHERAPDVGPNNIWWADYAGFSRYIKRMSWIMTDSVNVTRLAILSEADHLSWQTARPLFEQQIEFNYLEEELLQTASRQQPGQVHIAKQVYDTIVLVAGRQYEAATWERLRQFVSEGGWVGEVSLPDDSAPAVNTEERYAVSSPDIGQLRFADPASLAAALGQRLSKRARFQSANGHTNADLRLSHVVKGDVHLFVLVNEGEEAISGELHVPLQGHCEWWEAWSGRQQQAVGLLEAEGMTLALHLERRASLIVAVDPSSAPASASVRPATWLQQREALNRQSLQAGWRVAGQREAVHLTSWTMWDGLTHFSGTMRYERELVWHADRRCREVVLDLGEVHELARVFVNGMEAGVGLWSPYRFEIGHLLHNGANRLRIDVTNTLANRHDGASLPSGLLGPVTLNSYG